MGYKPVVVLLLILPLISFVFGNACTDACNANYARGINVTFCSHTGETFSTNVAAIYQASLNSGCYAKCGYSVKHVGACGCPNDCFSQEGHGVCSSGTCQCQAGWGGADCSTIKCPSTCSGHGVCVTQSASKGGDICQCSQGYTANDCSVPIPAFFNAHPYGSLNFGEPAGAPYYAKDKYNDAHPYFNYSNIATVKITITDANLAYLLNPSTIYDVDYVAANMYFYNGAISKNTAIQFRVKGFSSRLHAKKSFNVKMDKDKDIKGFSLKQNFGDRQVSSQVVWDVYRSQKSETYRHAHAQLYINGYFYGLVSLEERIDDQWMESRYNVNEKNQSNMYKVGPFALNYLGATADDYINYRTTLFDGHQFDVIEQEEGNGDWSDFLEFVTAINSSEAIATQYLQNHFGLNSLAKGWALETAFRSTDASLGTGNNYILLDTKEGDGTVFDFVGFDFDTCLTASEPRFAAFVGLPLQTLLDMLDAGAQVIGGIPVTVFVMNKNPYLAIQRKDKPLSIAALRVPGFNDTFTQAYKNLVQSVIINNPGRTEEIRQAHQDLVRPIVAQDRMYTISNTGTGASVATFDAVGLTSKAWIKERWAYLASMFYANGHGTCDDLGKCTCFEGYFGPSCNDFCGASFTQQKTGSWNDGTKDYSQYQVTLNVASQPLRQVVIEAVYNASSFSLWNLNQQSAGSKTYTIPSWQYQNGAIPANSNSVSFGYTISSASPAKFKLNNNACSVPSCTLEVTAIERGSWQSGNTINKQYDFQVRNTAASAAANVKIQLNFQSGTYVSSSWNIAPSTTTPGAASEQFTLTLWNLAPGSTTTSNGAILTAPLSAGAPSFTVSYVSGNCL